MKPIVRENERAYIEGVRKMTWASGEMCEFASALTAAINCMGEDIPYHYVLGTSGAAFRFTIDPGEWDFGNYSIRNIAADPHEPARRAIEAAGYACTIHEKGDQQVDAERIMESIHRGAPVLAHAVVGPSDMVIITGYDDGGEVLLGWSTYQDLKEDHDVPHDATGYFRKPGWHENLSGYIILGPRVGAPPPQKVYLDAVKWAVSLMRTPALGRKATGLEGLRVWAGEMTQEKYFPADDPELVGWRYVGAAVNMTMLRDHCLAEPFLRQAALDVPGYAPELLQAADCYAEMKQMRDSMDEVMDDLFSEKAMKAIFDPAARQAYAQKILDIRAKEEQGITHLERLLERCQ